MSDQEEDFEAEQQEIEAPKQKKQNRQSAVSDLSKKEEAKQMKEESKTNLASFAGEEPKKDSVYPETSSIKMNVMVFANSIKEGERMKSKFYDIRFTKMYSGSPDTKDKLQKDCHGIVVISKDKESFDKLQQVLFEKFSKHAVKCIFGYKPENIEDMMLDKWAYYADKSEDDVKQYLKDTFEKEVDNIRRNFISIDENKSGALEPIELARVTEKLGVKVSKEEIDACVTTIDTDGDGTINLEEFTLWWLSGREGASAKMNQALSNWAAQTQKYTNFALNKIADALKKTTKLETQDMRHFNVNFQIGDYKDENCGIRLSTQFGIIDGKQEPVQGIRQNLGFNDKDPFFTIRFNLNTERTQEIVEEIKDTNLVQMFERYVNIYNNKTENASTPSKFSIQHEAKAIILGIQGGHQLQDFKQNYFSTFENLFDKIIKLQSKITEFGFYQYVTLETKFGVQLVDLLSSQEKSILENLMTSANLNLRFSLLNKLDDILLAIYKQYQESNKKKKLDALKNKSGGDQDNSKSFGFKADSANKQSQEKQEDKKQNHLIHMVSLLLKTRVDAKFKLDYNDEKDFENAILSWFPDSEELLAYVPAADINEFKILKREFDRLDETKDLENISQELSTFGLMLFDQIQVKSIFEDIFEYIQKNKKESSDQSNAEFFDKCSDEAIGDIMSKLIFFILTHFEEKVDIMFFFKNCFLKFELEITDFRKVLYGLGKCAAYNDVQLAEQVEEFLREQEELKKQKEEEAEKKSSLKKKFAEQLQKKLNHHDDN